MQTFAMLTRLEPDGLQSPIAVEDLEHRVMEHIRVACPTAHWIASYAAAGRTIISTCSESIVSTTRPRSRRSCAVTVMRIPSCGR